MRANGPVRLRSDVATPPSFLEALVARLPVASPGQLAGVPDAQRRGMSGCPLRELRPARGRRVNMEKIGHEPLDLVASDNYVADQPPGAQAVRRGLQSAILGQDSARHRRYRPEARDGGPRDDSVLAGPANQLTPPVRVLSGICSGRDPPALLRLLGNPGEPCRHGVPGPQASRRLPSASATGVTALGTARSILRRVPARLRRALPAALRLLAARHRSHRREVPHLRRSA